MFRTDLTFPIGLWTGSSLQHGSQRLIHFLWLSVTNLRLETEGSERAWPFMIIKNWSKVILSMCPLTCRMLSFHMCSRSSLFSHESPSISITLPYVMNPLRSVSSWSKASVKFRSSTLHCNKPATMNSSHRIVVSDFRTLRASKCLELLAQWVHQGIQIPLSPTRQASKVPTKLRRPHYPTFQTPFEGKVSNFFH